MPPPSPSSSSSSASASASAAAASLADERARRRAALLASCEEADRREEAEQSCKLEKARKDAEAAGVTQAEGRAWMDAAKQGQVATLTAMIKENKRVLAYRGQGTSYSLMGHTALHWVCAKGHVQAAKMLIDSGLDANAVNNGGTHALFSAAAHGQASTARFLLVYGKCNAKLQDEFGNTAREEAVTRKKNDVVAEIDLYSRVVEVVQAGAAAVPLKVAMAMLQLGGVAQSEWHGVEKAQLVACANEFARKKYDAAMKEYLAIDPNSGPAPRAAPSQPKESVGGARSEKLRHATTAAEMPASAAPAPSPASSSGAGGSSGGGSGNRKKKSKKQAPSAAEAPEEIGKEPGPPYLELYNTLSLKPTCTADEIRKAYRTLAVKWHPDKNGGDEAAMQRFQLISQANDVLSDPRRRRLYDRTGEREDIPAEDFKEMYKQMMAELFGDMSVNDVMATLSSSDLKRMPPFPFPECMFPPRTFPRGMKFSDGIDTMGAPWEDLFPPETLASIKLDPSRSYGGTMRGGMASKMRGGGRGGGGRARGRGGRGGAGLDDDDDLFGGMGMPGMSETDLLRMFSEMLDADDRAGSGDGRGRKGKKGRKGKGGGQPELSPEMLKKMMETMMKMEMGGDDDEDEDDDEDYDSASDMSDDAPPPSLPKQAPPRASRHEPPPEPPQPSHKHYETVPTAAAVDEILPERSATPAETSVAGGGEDDGDSLIDQCRKKGNEAFAQGNYMKAEHQYSMALRFDKYNHVLFSNRSAARCAQKKYDLALEDADSSIRYSKEKWPKAFARKGAALVGLGQAGEALKWYQKGIALDANDMACHNGMAEAKRAIAEAQQRYDDMWGAGSNRGASSSSTSKSSATTKSAGRTTSGAESSGAAASSSPAAEPAVQPASARAAMLRSRTSAAESTASHPRDVTKRWLDAAKEGDLDGLKSDIERFGVSIVNVAGTGVGHRALHWTCARGHLACSRYLLSVGADPNLTNSANRTPLHAAASNGEATSCTLLLLEGLCDATALDEDGLDATGVARAAGHTSAAQAIEKARGTADAIRTSPEGAADAAAAMASVDEMAPTDETQADNGLTEEEEAEYGAAGEDASTQTLGERSDIRKSLGNAAFGRGDYTVAARHYTNALSLWAATSAAEVKSADGRRARAMLHANRSACRLKRSQPDLALEDALASHAADKGYGKAYMRLAQAYVALGNSAEACKICERGLQVDASNAALKDLLAEVRKGRGTTP